MWLGRGGCRVVLNHRLGTARMKYAGDTWVGYTLFFRKPA